MMKFGQTEPGRNHIMQCHLCIMNAWVSRQWLVGKIIGQWLKKRHIWREQWFLCKPFFFCTCGRHQWICSFNHMSRPQTLIHPLHKMLAHTHAHFPCSPDMFSECLCQGVWVIALMTSLFCKEWITPASNISVKKHGKCGAFASLLALF